MSENQQAYCSNCYYPLAEEDKFCANCGQKNSTGKISLWSFFSVFFNTVFNLESKFFRTVFDIFVPGKLTNEFFKGRHIRYFHPVRLFIVTALLLIAAIGYQSKNSEFFIFGLEERSTKALYKKETSAKIDSLGALIAGQYADSAKIQIAFDSLQQKIEGKKSSIQDSVQLDKYIVIADSSFDQDMKIATKDFVNLSPKELEQKYPVDGFFNRLIFRQRVRLLKDESSILPFFLGNSLWIILVMMPFLAVILKILYFRRDYYYVEHLVFSFHTHAFLFLLAAFGIVISWYFNPELLALATPIIVFLYVFKSLLNVYQQGIIKTFIKLVLLSGIYFAMCIFFLIFGLLIGIALF